MTATPALSPDATAAADDDAPPGWGRRRWVIGLLIVAAVLVVFGPTVQYDFLGWDDTDNVTKNPHLNPITGDAPAAFWKRRYAQAYIPLVYTTWTAIATVAEKPGWDGTGPRYHPAPFHAANVLVYAGVALLAWRILALLFEGHEWAAAAGALVFALHPLKAEPVAWVTGLKDVLGGFWAVLAVWAYLRGARAAAARGDRGAAGAVWWAVATTAFVLALLSKTTMVAAAPVAWVLAQWRFGHRWHRDLIAAGWLVLFIPLFLVNRAAQHEALPDVWSPLWARPLIAADAAAFYLWKTLIPWPLATIYGRTPEQVRDDGHLYWTWVMPAAVVVAAIVWRRRAPWALPAAAVFLAGMVPTSGLVPFGHQLISTPADRYAFVSLLGVGVVVTALAAAAARRGTAVACCAAVIVACAVMTARQVTVWRDSDALFTHNLQVEPDNQLVHYQLGALALDRGDVDAARAHLAESLRLKAYNPRAYNTLAAALMAAGDAAGAEAAVRTALAQHPTLPEAQLNLATLLARQNRDAEALPLFETGLANNPPDHVNRFYFGNALARAGQKERAETEYREALRLNPGYAEPWYALATLAGQRGDVAGAVEGMRAAVAAKPDWPDALNALAYTLAANPKAPPHDPGEPVGYAERAVQLTGGRYAVPLDTLSIAYYVAGRREESLAVARQARAVAAQAGQAKLAESIDRRIARMTGQTATAPATTPAPRVAQ